MSSRANRSKTLKGSQASKNSEAKTVGGTKRPVSRRRWLPTWAIVLLLVALSGAAAYALLDYVILAKVPTELVGRWRVVSGQMTGATFEFRRDGTMIGRMFVDGKENVLEGKAKSDGKTLRTTSTNPFTGKSETGTQTILTLTATELVTEDKNGTRVMMERVP
jgi:uncharacterized protein (TIGR03066 family)